jgi:CheY-like chemotaxis protein
VQDEERRHIARDLHDVTGQKLAMQSMALSQVLGKSALDDESRRALSECANLTKQVSEEIRTLSYMLHPPLLDELGLASGLKWYVVGFERRTGIAVDVDIPRGFRRLPPDVELTFFRIVQESLTNVHRYSGSTKAFVRVRTSRNEVRVEVGDFGKGMRSALLNNLTGAVAPVGVGIQGMRGRMLQLSGKLEITSRPNKGTVVTAILPISKVLPAPITAAAASPRSETGVRPGQHQPRKRVLIADDHETLRRGLRTMLQEATEWDFYEAVDGREAVNKAMEIHPDLVILDINMPVLNGLVAARQILSDRPQTRILMFTVHDSDHIVKEIEAAGAHAYLSKNKAGDELVRAVKDLLSDTPADGVAGRPEILTSGR